VKRDNTKERGGWHENENDLLCRQLRYLARCFLSLYRRVVGLKFISPLNSHFYMRGTKKNILRLQISSRSKQSVFDNTITSVVRCRSTHMHITICFYSTDGLLVYKKKMCIDRVPVLRLHNFSLKNDCIPFSDIDCMLVSQNPRKCVSTRIRPNDINAT